jgi:hypothetical protein
MMKEKMKKKTDWGGGEDVFPLYVKEIKLLSSQIAWAIQFTCCCKILKTVFLQRHHEIYTSYVARLP